MADGEGSSRPGIPQRKKQRAGRYTTPRGNSAVEQGRFSSALAQERYDKVMSFRKPIPDRKLEYTVACQTFLRSIIDFHEWNEFVYIQATPKVELLKEFYSNLSVRAPSTHTVLVRGHQLPFDSRTINSLLKTPARDSCAFLRELRAERIPVDRVIQATCLPGTSYSPEMGRNFRIRARQDLLPEAKVVFYFVIHSVMPYIKQDSISFNLLLLIYCILTRQPIDVGRIVSWHAQTTSNDDHAVGMPFPSLIQLLWAATGAGDPFGGLQVKPKASLSYAIIAKFYTQVGRPAPRADDRYDPAQPAQPAPSTSTQRQTELRSKLTEDRRAKSRAPQSKKKSGKPSILKTLVNIGKAILQQGRIQDKNNATFAKKLKIPLSEIEFNDPDARAEDFIAYSSDDEAGPSTSGAGTSRQRPSRRDPEPDDDDDDDDEEEAADSAAEESCEEPDDDEDEDYSD